MTSLYDLFSITMTKMWRADGSGATAGDAVVGGDPAGARAAGAEGDVSEQPIRITKTKIRSAGFTKAITMAVS